MLRIKFIAFTVASLLFSLCGFAGQTVASDSIAPISPAPAATANIPAVINSSAEVAQTIINGLEDILIPLVAIISPFLVGFLTILFVLKYQLSKKKAKYAVVTKALEMGKDLPAEFFKEESKKKRSPLEASLVLIAVGLGMIVLGWIVEAIFYGVGAICIFIGIAKFIAWKIEIKKDTDSFNPTVNE
ncbi:MAG: DUF6249 domain-containing protein [Bacteroidales bacterium]